MILVTDYVNGTIVKMDNDGSGRSILVLGTYGSPTFIKYSSDLDKIYWAADGSIHRSNTDGSDIEAYVVAGSAGDSYVATIAIDGPNAKIYYSRPAIGMKELYVSDADGSNEVLIASGVRVDVLAIDQPNQRLYYLEAYKHLTRIDTDGNNKTLLLTDAAVNVEDIGLDLVNNKVYWSDSDSAKIYRSNLDGSGKESIFTSEPWTYLLGIYVDTLFSKLYWTEWGPYFLKRSNLDGSSIETVAIFDGRISDVYVFPIPTSIVASGDFSIRGRSTKQTNPRKNAQIKAIDGMRSGGKIIGSFSQSVSWVEVRVWSIINGIPTQIDIADPECYQTGNSINWYWSIDLLYFELGSYYYFEMIADNGEVISGEFFLNNRGRWVP